MLLPARRRFKLSAFLAVLLFIGITFTLVPEFMNTSLKRLTSFRAHLFSVPTPFAQANIASRTTQLDKIGSAISTTRPVTTSATMSDYKNEVDAAIKDNFVMVFSKSYCPVSLREIRPFRRSFTHTAIVVISTALLLRSS
jgi:uncharacterized protein (UPF0333 family)